MKYLFFLLLLTASAHGLAQRHDNNFVSNRNFDDVKFTGTGDVFNTNVILNFDNDSMRLIIDSIFFNTDESIRTYSDSDGKLLMGSCGGSLLNTSNGFINGGDTIGVPTALQPYMCESFYGFFSDTLAFASCSFNNLPQYFFFPLSDSIIGYVQAMYDWYSVPLGSIGFQQLLLTKIKEIDNEFTVISVDTLLPAGGEYSPALVFMDKHANGRDWWIFAYDTDIPGYVHKILVTPDTFSYLGTTNLEGIISDNFNYTSFSVSNKGDKLAAAISNPSSLKIYDIDRCTGDFTLTDKEYYGCFAELSFLGCYGGVVDFSKDDRYLYASTRASLLRFDMASENFSIDVDTLWRYVDTFPEVSEGYQDNLSAVYLVGPDDKLYTCPGSNDLLKQMTPIDIGDGVSLRIDTFSLEPLTLQVIFNQNMRYRVGPIDGSACDTLGIDNNPLAAWTYTKIDTMGLVSFNDLTDYLPTYWQWDFADGDTSSLENPLHQYAEGGAYYVCLIVGNENSADTLCKWVYISGTVPTNDASMGLPVSVYPNPLSGQTLTLDVPDEAPASDLFFELTDVTGRLLLRVPAQVGKQQVAVGALPAGVYVYTLVHGRERLVQGKLVVGR